MASRETITRTVRHIQPIWSTSTAEARSRVVKLYKTWYRQIPTIGKLLSNTSISSYFVVVKLSYVPSVQNKNILTLTSIFLIENFCRKEFAKLYCKFHFILKFESNFSKILFKWRTTIYHTRQPNAVPNCMTNL